MNEKHEKIQLFVHAEGKKPKVIEAEPADALSELLKKADVVTSSESAVFCGESRSTLQEENNTESEEDAHKPANINSTVAELKLRKNSHIHCYCCRHIDVTVNYENKTKQHKFSPATTIDAVRKWALKKFHLTDIDADKLVLQVCGTNERPRPTQYLGELVQYPDCSICFDLVPDIKIEG